MSDKKVILEDQAKLAKIQLDTMEEVQTHLVKAQSMIDVISNSIEGKNKDNTLDLASELNSLVTVYDELEHAVLDSDQVLDALKELTQEDETNE